MIRLLTAFLDIGLLSMLVTFTVDAGVRRDFPRQRWLLLAALTWLLLAAAIVLESDALYLSVMTAYVVGCIFALTTRARLRTLVATLFLTLIAGLPLVTIVFVLNVLGIDVVFGHGDALEALAALANVAVIFWVWRMRRRYGDALAIRFSVGECMMAVVLFLLTTLLGLVMNPASGELAPAVLVTGSGQFLVGAVTALMVFLNVCFLVMVWRSKTTAFYRRQNALNAQYVENELAYFESYKAAQDDIRRFRHDMKHHMARLRQFSDAGDTAGLRDYLDDLQDAWTASAGALYRTGSDHLDAVLNGRAAQMRKAGITVTVEGAFRTPLRLSAFDACAIFANAIDNAIEANLRLPETASRWLRLTIRQSAQTTIVTLENPLAAPLAPGQRTSKADSRDHGFGLYSIREKAEKNGGSIEIEQVDGVYRLHLFLPC